MKVPDFLNNVGVRIFFPLNNYKTMPFPCITLLDLVKLYFTPAFSHTHIHIHKDQFKPTACNWKFQPEQLHVGKDIALENRIF